MFAFSVGTRHTAGTFTVKRPTGRLRSATRRTMNLMDEIKIVDEFGTRWSAVEPLGLLTNILQCQYGESIMVTKRTRALSVLVTLVMVNLAVVSYNVFAKGGNGNPGVLPPSAKYRGHTYGEWGARWWQAAFASPIVDGDHPLFSGGAFGGEDGVLFLSGVGGEAIVELTIPPGTALFFPVVNSECSVIEPDPFHGDDEEELRDCANDHIDNTSGRFAFIDGVAVKNLDAYRVESPLFEFGPLPEDNILSAPAGATSVGVDAGVYLLLAPLSVGEHVLSFGGTFDEFGFSIDTTYLITVVPKKRK